MQVPHSFQAHASYVLDLIFTADSRTLISSSMDNSIRLWSVPDWELRGTLLGHENSANSLALAPDETLLASGSTDATVRLRSLPAGQLLRTLPAHKKTVARVAISPDGRWLASASYDSQVKLWSLPAGELVTTLRGHPRNAVALAFAPDSRTLVTGGLGDAALVWSVPAGELLATLPGHYQAVAALQFTPAGELLALDTEKLCFWSPEGWELERTLTLPGGKPISLAFAPDGRLAAAAVPHGLVLLSTVDWSIIDKSPVKPKGVTRVVFSPDGRWLALGAADKRVRIWEMDNVAI